MQVSTSHASSNLSELEEVKRCLAQSEEETLGLMQGAAKAEGKESIHTVNCFVEWFYA